MRSWWAFAERPSHVGTGLKSRDGRRARLSEGHRPLSLTWINRVVVPRRESADLPARCALFRSSPSDGMETGGSHANTRLCGVYDSGPACRFFFSLLKATRAAARWPTEA